MLNSLSIKNVAIINSLEIDMKNGFIVLTGETGAGKSIIIDSINMILGERADRELVRHGSDKAVVQAVFSVDENIGDILKKNDIETDGDQIIITRRLTSEGKSIAKINGDTVTLNLLREVSNRLINIHGQHDNQALLNPIMHITFLDEFAKNEQEINEYQTLYHKMCDIKKEIERLKINEKEKQQRIDILEYQINEISSAKLEPGEEESLKNTRDVYVNAEKISFAISKAYTNLYDNNEAQSAYDGISIAANALSAISNLNSDIESAYNTLSEIMYSIEDISHSLNDFGNSIEYNEVALNEIEERLEFISKLKRKYGDSIEDIITFKETAQKELDDIILSEEKITKLLQELDDVTKKLETAGYKLTETRHKSAQRLQKKIEDSLHELNMEKTHFNISVISRDEYTETGRDLVEFLISTNPGEPLKPLVKIASGGELSRIMLAIKSVLAYADKVDTLVFDEIDTGVSGSAAAKIAEKLKGIAKHKQVICITHLPQLAAAADVHYLIEKNIAGESAFTTVKELDIDGRIAELSRIIDGDTSSALAREHAREMLGV